MNLFNVNADEMLENSTNDAGSSPLQVPSRAEKRRTLVGPWKNVAEFNKVYDWIYADTANNATQRRALSQMRVWSLRRSTLCPAAVLATIVILEVQLKDAENSRTLSDLQTLYASALTRFYNYMSSIMQTHNMRTMYDTARRLGLETFVVDLRHICAHGQTLPTLDMLRNTCAYCMRWLHDYYWLAQCNTMCDVDATHIRQKDKTQFDENVSQLFGLYDTALECYLKGAHNMKSAKRHMHGKRFAQLKEYYMAHQLQQLSATFDIIVKDLAALVKREVANIKDLPEIYIEAMLKMKYFFTLSDTSSVAKNLETLIKTTQSLFRMLAVCGFIEDLFYSLLQIAENPINDGTRRAGASFWARQIVAGFVAFRKCKQLYKAELDENPNTKEFDFSTLNFNNTSENLRYLLVYSGVDTKRTLIFGDSLRRPWVWVFERSFIEERLATANAYTASVLKALLPLVEPALDNTAAKTLTALIDAQFEDNAVEAATEEPTKKEHKTLKIYTAHDLLQKMAKYDTSVLDMYKLTAATEDAEELQYGAWKIVPTDETHNWTICALGRLPWE